VIRVAIAASSAIVRAGLAAVLGAEDGIEVAGDDPGAVDVVVTDSEDGDPAFRDEAAPSVVLIDHPEAAWIAAAIRAGVRAILPRAARPAEIAAAVRAAAAGLVSFDPAAAEELLGAAPTAAVTPETAVEPLTPREIEVLRMMADGASNKVLAGRLGISDHTAKFHVASVLAKLGAGTRTEAVTIGIRRGLVLL
jgi:two-component system, NarL family, response regulator YdfI